MAQICANLRDTITEDLMMPQSWFAWLWQNRYTVVFSLLSGQECKALLRRAAYTFAVMTMDVAAAAMFVGIMRRQSFWNNDDDWN